MLIEISFTLFFRPLEDEADKEFWEQSFFQEDQEDNEYESDPGMLFSLLDSVQS
jgi:hypothetical protein